MPSHPPFSLHHDDHSLARIQTVDRGNRDDLDVLAEFPEECQDGVYSDMTAGPRQMRRVSIPEKLHILGNDAGEGCSIAASYGGVPTVNLGSHVSRQGGGSGECGSLS